MTLVSFIIFVILTIYMFAAFMYLRANFHKVNEKDFKDRYGALTQGLQTREISAMYYPTVFMLHRYCYALYIVLLVKYSYF